MGQVCALFRRFCDALNGELEAAGCALQVSTEDPGIRDSILLLAADGSKLGWVPDHVDAPTIVAFEQILMDVDGKLGGLG